MSKDSSYHRSAVQYNEEFSKFAAALADKLDNSIVANWCRGISRQHKFHANQHQKALNRMENNDMTETQNIAGGGGSADPEDIATELSISEQQRQFAEQMEKGFDVDPMDADTNGLGDNPADDDPEETSASTNPNPVESPVEDVPDPVEPAPYPEPASGPTDASTPVENSENNA